MRMEGRGFKLDVSAHALLIADLTQERLVAEQEYQAACLAGGHLALADKAPSTPAQKEALLTALLSSDELARWRRTEKTGRDHYRRCEERLRIVIGKDADREIGRIYPKSRVPEGESFYTRCCNLPVQGACADASMLALALIDDRLFDADIDGGLVGWLHDEFIVEVRADQAERAAEIVKQSMIDGFSETFPGAPVSGLVDPHIGANWGEAKSGTPKPGKSQPGASAA